MHRQPTSASMFTLARWVVLLTALPLLAPVYGTSRDAYWRDYFEQQHACTLARVHSVQVAESIVVDLAIEPRWAQSLTHAPADVVDNWFAIHCPAEPTSEHVLIGAELPGAGRHLLDCRQWRATRERELAEWRAQLDAAYRERRAPALRKPLD